MRKWALRIVLLTIPLGVAAFVANHDTILYRFLRFTAIKLGPMQQVA